MLQKNKKFFVQSRYVQNGGFHFALGRYVQSDLQAVEQTVCQAPPEGFAVKTHGCIFEKTPLLYATENFAIIQPSNERTVLFRVC